MYGKNYSLTGVLGGLGVVLAGTFSPREDLPPLEKCLSQVRSEITFLGFSLETVTRQHKDVIGRLLKQGVRITFLVLSPSSPLLGEVERAFGVPNLGDAVITSLGILDRMKTELSDAERDRLEVRTYDLMPLHGIVSIDPGTSEGMIQVEHYLYNTEPHLSPCHVVTKKENAELFERYWKSYLFVLERSHEVQFKDARPQPIKDLLLRLGEFQNTWYGKWRGLIESAALRSPENAAISGYADEVRRLMAQIDAEAIPVKPDLKAQIGEFAEEAGLFGEKITVIFPSRGVSVARYVESIKQKLLQQGDAVTKKLDDVIPRIKNAFS